jgi:hypothetical protein
MKYSVCSERKVGDYFFPELIYSVIASGTCGNHCAFKHWAPYQEDVWWNEGIIYAFLNLETVWK